VSNIIIIIIAGHCKTIENVKEMVEKCKTIIYNNIIRLDDRSDDYD
jgi:hypothetical protein